MKPLILLKGEKEKNLGKILIYEGWDLSLLGVLTIPRGCEVERICFRWYEERGHNFYYSTYNNSNLKVIE